MNLDDLIAEYKRTATSLTAKERAKLEQVIWLCVPNAVRRRTFRRDWLQDNLGVTHYQSEGTNRLLNAGGISDPIWERVDSKEMTVQVAAQILRMAKKKAEEGHDIVSVIASYLEVYDAAKCSYLTPKGQVKIKKGVMRKIGQLFPSSNRKPGKSGRDFWQNLRALIRDYVTEHLAESDQMMKDKVLTQLEIDLKTVIEEARMRINSEKARGTSYIPTNGKSQIEKVKASCRVLRIDYSNGNIDLDAAKKKKRMMARLYHPDLHGGSEEHREKYEQILEAYRVIENYMETQ